MEILGVGMPELIFIVLIALIVLGPKDMEKTGRTIGTWLRKIALSEEWRVLRDTTKKIGTLPNKWMREANPELGKWQKEMSKVSSAADAFRAWTGESAEEPPLVNTPEEPLDAPAESAQEPPNPPADA